MAAPKGRAVGLGPATITGGTALTFTGPGPVSIVATPAGDNNRNPAPDQTRTFTVAKVSAGVMLEALSHTCDGSPQCAPVTTDPEGLAVNATHDGLADAPGALGSYEVVAAVTEALYAGGATSTPTIAAEPATNVFKRWLQ
jgi:hypothetical protein